MHKLLFVSSMCLLFAWLLQIVPLSATPSTKSNRGGLNDEDPNLTNGVESPASPPQLVPIFNGTALLGQQKPQQEEELGPLSVLVQMENKTEHGNQFGIKFTDISFLLVCSAKFHVVVPSQTSVVNYWDMTPVPDAVDQFTLPEDVHLYPSNSHSAGVLLDGAGQPDIVILETVTVLTTEQCPTKH